MCDVQLDDQKVNLDHSKTQLEMCDFTLRELSHMLLVFNIKN